MRLPPDDQAGSLDREQVLQVLRLGSVHVLRVEDGCYILDRDPISEVHLLTETVPRQMIQYLARKFGIQTIYFYYPNEYTKYLRQKNLH